MSSVLGKGPLGPRRGASPAGAAIFSDSAGLAAGASVAACPCGVKAIGCATAGGAAITAAAAIAKGERKDFMR